MGKFSIGLDLGSQQAALAVFDHTRQCAVPLEIDGDKTMPSCIALEPGGGDAVVGKRAEHRSAKKCEGVLCAYRQMLYGTCKEWGVHRKMCNERWHFNVAEDEAAASAMDAQYLVKDEKINVQVLIGRVVEVVCASLVDASVSGGALVNENGDEVTFVNFSISVPECLTEDQRTAIAEGAKRIIHNALGPLPIMIVNETLAVAMQFCSTPPFRPRKFMCLDLGSSKCTMSIFELKQVSVDLFSLQELISRTDVFIGSSEIEYRMMLWCEKRKPFAESMLSSKAALFKLRREVRGAMKTLTVAEEAMIEADSVVAGNDLQLMLTLEDFEHECKDLFDAVSSLVEVVVKEGGVGFAPELVLAGGAMRIPRLQRNIEKLIGMHGAVIRKTVDMDRAVSLGAATIAALHHGVGVVRLPLDEAEPYREQPSRIRLGKEPSGVLRELSREPEQGPDSAENKEVEDLRVQNEALRNRNKLLKEAEEAMQGQLYDQQQLIERLRHGALVPSDEPEPAPPIAKPPKKKESAQEPPFRLEERLPGETDDTDAETGADAGQGAAAAHLRGQLLLVQQETEKARGEAAELRGRLSTTEAERDALAAQCKELRDLVASSAEGASALEAAVTSLLPELLSAQRSMEEAAKAAAAACEGQKQADALADALNNQVLTLQAQNLELEGQRQAADTLHNTIKGLEEEVSKLQKEKLQLEEGETKSLLRKGGEEEEEGEEKSDASKRRSGKAASRAATEVPRTRYRLRLWRFSLEFVY